MLSQPFSIALALLAAMAAGLVGSFALLKRMALAGDVMSHVALPGIGIALLFSFNPLLGAATTLFIGAILISQLEKQTGLTTETTIGVIFAASLAIGALITPSEELINALFGNFSALSPLEFIIGVVAGLIVLGFIFRYKDQLVLALFSPELAASAGVNLARLNLYFLLVFSLTIILGLRFLGALLVGALIIIPAAIGRQLTHTFDKFLLASCIASLLSVAVGYTISANYNSELGPTVIAVAAFLFLVSLLKKKK